MEIIIKQVENRKNKILLSLSTDEIIEVPKEIYLKYLLHEGDSFSEKEKEKFVSEVEIFKIRQSAFRYLSCRNHSKFELKVKLLRKGYNKELIEIVLDDLIKNNLLNDYDFAQYFFESKSKKSVGLNKIKAELLKKGLDRKIVDEISKEYKDAPSLFDSAMKLVSKKYQLLLNKNLENKKIRQKIYFSLINKGYSKEIILDSFRKLKI